MFNQKNRYYFTHTSILTSDVCEFYKYVCLKCISVGMMDLRWQHPFTAVVAGPTGCGKTEWVFKFIANREFMINPAPVSIVYSYGEWQPSFKRFSHQVEFVEGFPELPERSDNPLLLIIDDQMDKTGQKVSNLFTKGSHHRNISVIYIVQNLFDKNSVHRTISLNAHYIVAFKNPRDKSQIVHLAKQLNPGNIRYVHESFILATEKAHGYLVIDLKQSTPENLRYRSHIFPGETQRVYVPA